MLIPFDGTKPQSSEGTALFSTLPFVSRSPVNWLKHDLTVNYATSNSTPAARVIVALFRDSETDTFASAAKTSELSSADQLRIFTRVQAGNQSSQFASRIGIDTSFSSSILVINEVPSPGDDLGLTITSAYEVTEYMG